MKKLFSVLRQFLIIFLPSFVMISVVTGSIFWGHMGTERRLLNTRETDIVRLHEKTILSTFNSIVTDLLFLSEEEMLKDLLDKGGSFSREKLAREWALFADRRRVYEQITYIDTTGMEVVGINRSQGDARSVPHSELRNRAQTFYFKDSLPLSPGDVRLTPSELDTEEDGKAALLKPVLRFATPVFDRRGRKRGILLLTCQEAGLFPKIAEVKGLHAGSDMIVNPNGYWLYGPNPQSVQDSSPGNGFSRAFPSAWENISRSAKGEFTDEKGFFVFTTVYPLKEGLRSGTGPSGAVTPGEGGISHEHYYWKIISYVPAPVLNRLRLDVLTRYFMLYTVILTLLGIGAWVVSREWLKEKELAETDVLTGICNRRKFYSHMETERERSIRYTRPLSLLMFDIDLFKRINDAYGHAVGDRVLQTLVSIIQRHTRRMDVFTRYGGEEFIILCPETNIRNAAVLAERLRSAIEAADFGQAGPVTVSLGAAELKSDESGDEFIKRVDDALYSAKQKGRNRVEVAGL